MTSTFKALRLLLAELIIGCSNTDKTTGTKSLALKSTSQNQKASSSSAGILTTNTSSVEARDSAGLS